MLDLAILGLLRERPMHGYELKNQLPGLGLWRVSFGSVYPALKRLERHGYVESHSGRGRRKEYRITDPGVQHFEQVLSDPSAEVDNSTEFRVRLSLFRYLPAATRALFLERRITVLERRLAAIRSVLANPPSDRYIAAELAHRARVTELDIEFLSGLATQELAHK